MNSYLNIQSYFATGSLLVASMQIAATVILLRERSGGPWLMLGGAIVSLMGVIGLYGAIFAQSPSFGWSHIRGRFQTLIQIQLATSGLAMLGSLTFGAGLLLHALRRQAMARRIEELETIIAARDAA